MERGYFLKTAIIYYSRSNNTRTGAKYLAGKIYAELIELVEEKGRQGFFGFVKSGYQAVSRKESLLQGEPWKLIDSYKRIILMSPIWGSNSTPAINSFLKRADLKDKEIITITFQADKTGKGSDKVYHQIKELIQERGGIFLKGIPLHSAPPGKYAGKEYIVEQIETINL